MENGKKKVWVWGIISIVSFLLILMGISYAYWKLVLTQETNNMVISDCFKLTLEDNNEINLPSSVPIRDEEGMEINPYTFTITNVCDSSASYQINLEELEAVKQLPSQYIKISFNNQEGKLLNTYPLVETTISNATSSHKLTTGVLRAKEEKTFTLRLWLDYNTPAVPEAMNASFLSKITIVSSYRGSAPEINVLAEEILDGIRVDASTVSNPKNEELKYYYQLNNENWIESENSSYHFQNLSDGTYQVGVRVEDSNGFIIEERKEEVNIAYEKVYVSNTGNDEEGNGSKDQPFVSLQPAYNKVKSGGEVILLSDITATSTVDMNIENKEVTLRSEDNIYTVIKDANFTKPLLNIENYNVINTNNIIFDGNEVISEGSLIESRNSTLNLNEKTTVQRNNNRGKNYVELKEFRALGGGIFSYNSTLNINGANIIHNKTSPVSGGGSNGGGVYVNGGSIALNSGTISYNKNEGTIGNKNGGGLALLNVNFNMNDGEISHNSSNRGGGIFISNTSRNSTMIMTGGSIQNNVALLYGGGGLVSYVEIGSSNSTIVYLRGGIITNNSASPGPNLLATSGGQIIDQR